MLNPKEFSTIIATAIVLAFAISLISSINFFLTALASIFLAILTNVLTKKITSHNLDSEIDIRFWEIQRYGFAPRYSFKKPFPMGILLPILTTILTLGNFYWLASLVFEVKPKVYRASKRWGLYTFSEMTEHHIGLIAASGIAINLLLAIAGYFVGFPIFAKINLYYAFFNLIPISNLDGNKIFFGNLVLWSFLAIVTLIGLGYALFLV